MMARIVRAADRHWFAPASLRDLALVRIVLVGAQLLFFLPDLRSQLWLTQVADAYYVPIPAQRLVSALLLGVGGGRPDAIIVSVAWLVAVASGIGALVGVFTRTSLVVFTASNVLLISHGYSFLPMHHPEAILILALGALAVAPSGEAFSVDHLRRRFRIIRSTERFVPPSPDEDLSPMARWPLRLVQWLLVLVYFSAAMSKAQNGGFAWFHPATLQHSLVRDGLINDTPLAFVLARFPWAVGALAIGVFILEGTFWVPMAIPRLIWVYVLGGVALHTGIWAAQGVEFGQFIVLYVVFIEGLRYNWREWRTRTSHGEPARAWTVLYDGACPRCVRTMAILASLDGARHLRYLDIERDWAAITSFAPHVNQHAAGEAMHVIRPDGSVVVGFRALRALAEALPVAWAVRPLLRLPSVERFGERLYRRIAHGRRRVCTIEACRS